jgi:restriction system protein
MASSSDLILSTLELFWYLWPVMFLALFNGALKGRGSLSRSLSRAVRGTLVIWGIFLFIWFYLSSSGQSMKSILPESLFWTFGLVLIVLSIVSSGIKLFKVRGKMKTSRTVADLRSLSPTDFEQVVAETYRAMGHKVQHIGKLGDHGVDLVIRTDIGEKWIVQCKRWKGKVGEPVVRDFSGAMQHENADHGVIVTTGTFTKQAIEWARDKSIDLVDGDGLTKFLKRAQTRRDYRGDVQTEVPEQSVANSQASNPSDYWTDPIEGGDPPYCPQCGVHMKLRVARQGKHQGKRFYGCPNFPKCRTIIAID